MVGATDFPGVVVRLGMWTELRYPVCGCDVCDERPADLVRHLHEAVLTFVDGHLAERWDGNWLTRTWPGSSARTSTDADYADRLLAAAPPGTFAHPAWPRRPPPW